MEKKAQGLSFTMIIVFILGLILLTIIAVMIFTGTGLFGKELAEGECPECYAITLAKNCPTPSFGRYKLPEGRVCCPTGDDPEEQKAIEYLHSHRQ